MSTHQEWKSKVCNDLYDAQHFIELSTNEGYDVHQVVSDRVGVLVILVRSFFNGE